MARQISISENVYAMLSRIKGTRSFSQVILSLLQTKKKKKDIMDYFGIMKGDKKLLEIEKKIARDREKNYGRTFDW